MFSAFLLMKCIFYGRKLLGNRITKRTPICNGLTCFMLQKIRDRKWAEEKLNSSKAIAKQFNQPAAGILSKTSSFSPIAARFIRLAVSWPR